MQLCHCVGSCSKKILWDSGQSVECSFQIRWQSISSCAAQTSVSGLRRYKNCYFLLTCSFPKPLTAPHNIRLSSLSSFVNRFSLPQFTLSKYLEKICNIRIVPFCQNQSRVYGNDCKLQLPDWKEFYRLSGRPPRYAGLHCAVRSLGCSAVMHFYSTDWRLLQSEIIFFFISLIAYSDCTELLFLFSLLGKFAEILFKSQRKTNYTFTIKAETSFCKIN